MNRLLFTTDFSETSLNAFEFALDYAKKLELSIVVFHSYNRERVTASEKKIYNEIDIKNFRSKKDAFPPFEEILKNSSMKKIKIKYIVKKGNFLTQLKAYVNKKEDKIDAIVMGTDNNKQGLFDLFMDSNTIRVLEMIEKPLIAIPERVKFDGRVDNLLFLADYRDGEAEILDDLIEKTKKFKAHLHVLHVDLAHGESISPLLVKFKNELKKRLTKKDFNRVTFHNIDAMDFSNAVQEFCVKNKIDLVYLMNRKRNVYQRLFTYGIAEQLIKHLSTPVMAIYRDS